MVGAGCPVGAVLCCAEGCCRESTHRLHCQPQPSFSCLAPGLLAQLSPTCPPSARSLPWPAVLNGRLPSSLPSAAVAAPPPACRASSAWLTTWQTQSLTTPRPRRVLTAQSRPRWRAAGSRRASPAPPPHPVSALAAGGNCATAQLAATRLLCALSLWRLRLRDACGWGGHRLGISRQRLCPVCYAMPACLPLIPSLPQNLPPPAAAAAGTPGTPGAAANSNGLAAASAPFGAGVQAFKAAALDIVREYFDSGDAGEVATRLAELGEPGCLNVFVKHVSGGC